MYGLEDEDLQPQTALEDAEIDESDAWCAPAAGCPCVKLMLCDVDDAYCSAASDAVVFAARAVQHV